MTRYIIVLLVSLPLILAAGCSRSAIGGAAVGAGAAGAAYEYTNKRSLDALERDLQSGKISNEEYQRRKKEIQDKSLLY